MTRHLVFAAALAMAVSRVASAQVTTVNGPGTQFTNAGGSNANDPACPANGDWCARNVRNSGAAGITNTYARSGNGSIEFSLTGTNSKADFEYLYNGPGAKFAPFALSSLSSFGFDWYRNSASINSAVQHPVMRLYVDFDGLAGGQTGYLIYEGAYNGLVTAPTDSWQSVDVTGSSTLWAVAFGNGNCDAVAQMRTFSQWQAGGNSCFSEITSNAVVYGFSVGVGSGWDDFEGAVDNVRFQTAGMNEAITYNFEVEGGIVTPEPSTYALMAAGLAALGVVARRRRNRTLPA